MCDRIEPVGAGALELAYRALLEEIKGLGWTAVERKRAVPRFPRKVAVVTSRSAAALQDVLVTMRKRCCAVGARAGGRRGITGIDGWRPSRFARRIFGHGLPQRRTRPDADCHAA